MSRKFATSLSAKNGPAIFPAVTSSCAASRRTVSWALGRVDCHARTRAAGLAASSSELDPHSAPFTFGGHDGRPGKTPTRSEPRNKCAHSGSSYSHRRNNSSSAYDGSWLCLERHSRKSLSCSCQNESRASELCLLRLASFSTARCKGGLNACGGGNGEGSSNACRTWSLGDKSPEMGSQMGPRFWSIVTTGALC